MDDYSDDDLTKKYLLTNESLNLPKINWKEQILSNAHKRKNDLDIFNTYFYDLPEINTEVKGIKDKFTVVSPGEQLGDKNGVLWSIYLGFKFFPCAEYIIVLDDDIIFNKDWLVIADKIYQQTKNTDKPGLISVYNRTSDTITTDPLYFKIDAIGGVIFLIPKYVYNLLFNENVFNQKFIGDDNLSSDVFLYQFVLNHGLNIFNSSSSYIQHIGIKSICREGRFLRYSKNFLRPYAWNENFDK